MLTLCSFVQNPKGLCSPIKGLPNAILCSSPYLPQTLKTPVKLLGHVAQVAKQLSWHSGLVAEPSLIKCPTQTWQLCKLLNKWVRITYPNKYMKPSKSKKPTKYCAYFLVVERDILIYYKIPRKFTKMVGQIFVVIFPHLWHTCVLPSIE